MSEPRLHIVGLGPAGADLLTTATRGLLESGTSVLLRTRHHPAVAELDPTGRWASCDDLYARAASFDDAYAACAERAVRLLRDAPLIYAVPGHPLIAERSVVALIERANGLGLAYRVHAAVSWVDLAAAALALDLSGVQLCDALELRIDTQRPALLGQLYDREAVADLKLKLLEVYPADHQVTVLSGLGTDDEAQHAVALAELDHRAYGYLDSLFVPSLAPVDDVRRFDGLAYVVARLHAADGCPWDREQTHQSLRPHLLEESYEALEAIDAEDPESLTEELGDVLLQVLMHAAVAERHQEFQLADVVEQIARKLVRRHPHVFAAKAGDQATTAEQVYQNWDRLKKTEKQRASSLDGVPLTLPALAASQAIQGRARRQGFEWPNIDGPLEKLREEVEEFARASTAADREDEFGDILFVATNIADRLGVDAEQALRRANAKFRRRFARVEALAQEGRLDLTTLDLAALDELWARAKLPVD